MRKFHTLLMSLAAALFISAPALAQTYIPVTGSNVVDAGGAPLKNGTICFVATDTHDTPLQGFTLSGHQVFNRGRGTCATVSQGVIGNNIITALTMQIANPSAAVPAGFLYRITVTDLDSGYPVQTFKNVQLGSIPSFNYDTFVANPTAYTCSGCSWNAAATVSVGPTDGVPYGTPASVLNDGNSSQAILHFKIPQGQPGSPGPNCSVSSPAGVCDLGTDSLAAGSVIPAGGPYLDITNPRFGGICDGSPHLGGISGDLNVDAFQAAWAVALAGSPGGGGYTIGSPTGLTCVFTQVLNMVETTSTNNLSVLINTHGGIWKSQVTATPIANIYVPQGGGGLYSVCPTGMTVGGNVIPVVSPVTCTDTSPAKDGSGPFIVTKVQLANPNTGITFTGNPGAVVLTGGGTITTAATPIALLTGDFNFTIGPTPSGGITFNLLVENTTFIDAGSGSAVLANFDGGPYIKAWLSRLHLSHDTFKTTIAQTTGVQLRDTFEGGAYDINITGGTTPTSTSLGYYGLVFYGSESGGSNEWKIDRASIRNFDHDIYITTGTSDISIYDVEAILTYEEAVVVNANSVLVGIHTENAWLGNAAGQTASGTTTDRAGILCAASCTFVGNNDYANITSPNGGGQGNYGVKVVVPSNGTCSFVGGWSFNQGQTDGNGTVTYNYVLVTGSAGGRVQLSGIPTLNGNSDYVNRGSVTVKDSFVAAANGYTTTQSVSTMQWVQVGSTTTNGGYYAVGPAPDTASISPAFAATPNYTATNWTESAGAMAINVTGSNTFSPTTSLTIVSGVPYDVDVIVSSWTSGSLTINVGGASKTITTPVVGDNKVTLTTTSTANLSISASSTGAHMTLSSVSVQQTNYKFPAIYRAVEFSSSSFGITGQYADGSGVTHLFHCPTITGVTPPALGFPNGCVDGFTITSGGSPLNLSGVGVSPGKTFTFDPEGGQIPIGPSSTVANNIPSFSSTTGGMKDSGIASASVSRYCGESTFSAGTSGSAVTCSWVVSTSHCVAAWKGTPGAGILGVTAAAGSATPSASVSSTGTAALFCSVN